MREITGTEKKPWADAGRTGEQLYVSRTAISKWESGRGYPSIDSLKAIAKYFSVSVDDLLSGDTVLTIAEENRKQRERRSHTLVFGLLDCSAGLLISGVHRLSDIAGGGPPSAGLVSLYAFTTNVKETP